MLRRKILSTIIIAVWVVILFFLFIPIREEISHTYHHLVGASGELPLLTRAYSLEILGPGDYLDSEYSFVFFLFWGFLWLVPFTMLFFTWRSKDSAALLEYLFYSWLLYLLITFLLIIFALFGMIMPFLLI